MKPSDRFRKFAGNFVTISEAYTSVYVPAEGEYDEESLQWIVEDYHPMEMLDEGYEVVALCFEGDDSEEEPIGFVAVSDDDDLAFVYEDGNDEPLRTPASELSLELAE